MDQATKQLVSKRALAAEIMRHKGKNFFSVSEPMPVFFAVYFLCLCSFLAGFFGSFIISQDGTNGVKEKNGETGDSSVSPIPFQVLSWSPRTFYFPNFASAEQCQTIIEMAKSTLRPSGLALRKGETIEKTKGLRTSSGTFIKASDDTTGILDTIEEKIAQFTMLPRQNGETFNILRYEIGQRYVPHYDAFNPAEYGPQQNQRLASFLLYLTNVEEGGETMFPYENGSENDSDDCLGFKVKPRQGDGLLFYSLFPNGTIDKKALHGSCPVIRGEKWVATKWIRNQELYD